MAGIEVCEGCRLAPAIAGAEVVLVEQGPDLGWGELAGPFGRAESFSVEGAGDLLGGAACFGEFGDAGK